MNSRRHKMTLIETEITIKRDKMSTRTQKDYNDMKNDHEEMQNIFKMIIMRQKK